MKTQYITDNEGNKLAIILPMNKYNQMVQDLEEAEDIKLYDKVKREDKEPSIPAHKAFEIIEKERSKNK